MQDSIIKGTGNSRYLKGTGWPVTYEEFKSMAEAGALPIDLNGINADGWQQIGMAFAKATMLSDTTAAKYFASLTGAETVDQVLSLLGAALLKDGTSIKDPLGNLIALPSAQLDSRVQIATGSYTGTGTYGSSNKNSIVSDFPIKVAIIGSSLQLVWQKGVPSAHFIGNDAYYVTFSLSSDEKTLSWYSNDTAQKQLNSSGTSYPYVLIGG